MFTSAGSVPAAQPDGLFQTLEQQKENRVRDEACTIGARRNKGTAAAGSKQTDKLKCEYETKIGTKWNQLHEARSSYRKHTL